MRAPDFWSRPPEAPGLLPLLLTPAAWVWVAATRRRRARARPFRTPVPVVCVGNLTAGGAGKTPVAQAILEALVARAVRTHALTRGYGGAERGPHRVDLARDDAARVGDEPLLLAALAPTWVARDRADGARAAAAAGAEVVVMDDGFQNPTLAKDLSILVVDAAQGFGNGRVIPAGPLREPVADGLARADAVILLGDARAAEVCLSRWPALGRGRPVLRGRLAPLAMGASFAGERVVAFAGIGRPEKFFATLREAGAEIVAAHGFDDHAPYPPRVLRRLAAEAREAGALLVTTEKDAVRLPPAFRREVRVAPVRLALDDPAALGALLDRVAPRGAPREAPRDAPCDAPSG